MDSKDLVHKAIAGESFAWNQLYEKHYPWLYSLALKRCRSIGVAQDVVQETFVSAFLKLHQLKDPMAFPAWLKAILVRQCLRTAVTDATDSVSEFAVHARLDHFAEQAEEELLKAKLHHLLESLPEVLRGVLLLRYFSAWNSYEQIAGILCIPVGTVRSRLNQAKNKLLQRWRSCVLRDRAVYSNSDEWNEFYAHHFVNLYSSLSCRDNFLDHIGKDLELYRAGAVVNGRRWIEQEIEGDLEHGSYFRDVNVVGSGNISVVEVATQNSHDHPNRCPAQMAIVLFRKGRKVERLHLFGSR